jgi:hypothetical protein
LSAKHEYSHLTREKRDGDWKGEGVIIATSSDHDLLILGNRSSSSLAPTHLSFREWLLTIRVTIVQGHIKYTSLDPTEIVNDKRLLQTIIYRTFK